jgi:hypothetical protein
MFTKAQAEAYFLAEKQESVVFLIIGIVAILTAIGFLAVVRTPFYKGLSIPLIAIGIIQCTVGYTVYARSDAQRKDIVYKMDMNPDALRNEEMPRMKTVMKNFAIYRWVEISLLAIGLLMIFLFRNQDNRHWLLGIGVGLAIQSALMLGADYFAEKRGHEYFTGLKTWLKQ